MKGKVEDILKKADFSKGSNYKEELRDELFHTSSANILKFPPNRELSDDELDMIAAAGLYEDSYDDDDDDKE